MLKKVLTALAIVILVFVLVGAVLSREYRVSRAIVVPANSQFLRPTATGRIARSHELLWIGTRPSSRKAFSASH